MTDSKIKNIKTNNSQINPYKDNNFKHFFTKCLNDSRSHFSGSQPEIKKAPYWFPKIPNRRMKKLNNLHISIFAFDKAFKKVCEDITGKSLTAHGLRHTHASLLFEQGFTYDQVGRRLGHAGNSRVTREIYVHITEKLRIKDADAIQQIRLLS